MGLFIEKSFPFSPTPVECYLKISDLVYRKVNGGDSSWIVTIQIFLKKDNHDLGRASLFFRDIWVTRKENQEKLLSSKVIDYISNTFQVANFMEVLEEKEIVLSLPHPFYFYDSLDVLLKDVYKELQKKNTYDFKVLSVDNETEEQFLARVVHPYEEEIDAIFREESVP